MADERREKTIDQLGRIVTGKTPSTKVSEYFGGPIPFIKIPDLSDSPYVRNSAATLSEQGAAAVKSSALPPGAVMMSCIATLGRCGITTKPSITNQQINSVIPGEDVDPLYLYYAFRMLGPSLRAAGGGGSVYTNVSKSRFSALTISLPSLPQQHAIAHILGTLDDKIELNRRMNETLEEMARAIFKSWFVDFDAVPPGELVESELGLIPEGWEVRELSALATLETVSVKPQDAPETQWELFSIPAFDDGRLPTSDSGESIKSNKYRVSPDSVLVSKLNPRIPRIWMPCVSPGDKSICSTEFMPFRPTGCGRTFLFDFFWSTSAQQAMLSRVTGTTGSHQRVRPKEIAEMKVLVPPRHKLDEYEAVALPLHERSQSNTSESRTLAALRDILLPKILSGEIRVPEAEQLADEVA